MIPSALPRKLRVAVLYGGRSGEHEVSLQSAASVLRNLDPDRFEPIPIAIDKQGRWLLNDLSLIERGARTLPVFRDAPAVLLPPNPPSHHGAGNTLVALPTPTRSPEALPHVDVVFPVLHGTLCEDGTIQGLFELADVPYVGCGVLASAVGMDKETAKRLARDAGLPIVPYVTAHAGPYGKDPQATHDAVASQLGYPCFVKPSASGSSVGVSKVKTASDLPFALKEAFRYDRKVLIEQAIFAREIEVAVLEHPDPAEPPLCSIVGEINPAEKHEFYSYTAKYLDETGAVLRIPAELSPEQHSEAQRLAALAFTTLGCEGLARVDFFLDRRDGRLYFNEVNTLPGFTSVSMYPKLWEASGIPYRELLSRLIDLALLRAQRKAALVRDFRAE
ncbi:MAG: D-alanine--D-alanine ligase [Myxococcales bacterium]|nr:D-alanine--D-alanine ligase [Myxococcales bacterium]